MIVGTAGHIDHGKTSLVRALTGVDTDRLKEEKARGISIDLGFAYLPAPDGGRARLRRRAGPRALRAHHAGRRDRHRPRAARRRGRRRRRCRRRASISRSSTCSACRRGVVALTKSDLVDADAAARRPRPRSSAALAGTALAGAEILPVSTVTGEGVAALRDAPVRGGRATSRRARRDGRFRLAVDRSFTLAGAGTVVTGTVLSGAVGGRRPRRRSARPGSPARVRSIHAQNRAGRERPGGRPLRAEPRGRRHRPRTRSRAATSCSIRRCTRRPTRIDAELRLLAGEPKPVGTWMPVRLHHGAREVAARIVPLGDGADRAGRRRAACSSCSTRRSPRPRGDRFVLRDTVAHAHHRRRPLARPARARPQAPHAGAPGAARRAGGAERRRGARGAARARRPSTSTSRPSRATARSRRRGRRGAGRAASASSALAAAGRRPRRARAGRWARLRASLRRGARGLSRRRIRTSWGSGSSGCACARAAPAGAGVPRRARRGSRPTATRRDRGRLGAAAGPRGAARARGRGALGDASRRCSAASERFRPPRVRDIAGTLAVAEAGHPPAAEARSAGSGASTRSRTTISSCAPTVAEMVGIATPAREPCARRANSRPRSSATRLDNGRKVAIQILEFFDRHGVTLRRGDLRRINRHRLDLLRPRRDGAAMEGEASPVGRPDFKSGRGREPVPGGFDPHSLPPTLDRRRPMTVLATWLAGWTTPRGRPTRRRPPSGRSSRIGSRSRPTRARSRTGGGTSRPASPRRSRRPRMPARPRRAASPRSRPASAGMPIRRARTARSWRFSRPSAARSGAPGTEPRSADPARTTPARGTAAEPTVRARSLRRVEAALDAFERAYAARTGTSFWILFDNPMPETPRVDY